MAVEAWEPVNKLNWKKHKIFSFFKRGEGAGGGLGLKMLLIGTLLTSAFILGSKFIFCFAPKIFSKFLAIGITNRALGWVG